MRTLVCCLRETQREKELIGVLVPLFIIKLMLIPHGDEPLSFIENYNSLLEDKSVKDEKVKSFFRVLLFFER